MVAFPKHLKFTPNHVWVKTHDHTATVGLADDLQHEITAIESIDLPLVDDELEMDLDCVTLHLADVELYHIPSPLTGRVIEVNADALDQPEQIFLSPYERGWLFKMEYDEPDELEMLMSSTEYAAFLEEIEG